MKTPLIILALMLSATAHARALRPASVAGLFPLEGSGRVVCNFNPGWRFNLGDSEGAEAVGFDDSAWPLVCAPHTVCLEPSEASGGRNYQGVCWYRKRFVVPATMKGLSPIVHFEAIMGRQEVYVNGRLATRHLGGYLPVSVDLAGMGVSAGDTCLIAVRADNSDDKSYPPGKKQSQLDFSYHGGIYRDVWLIGRSPSHITDPLERGQVAGGGVFIHFGNITPQQADVFIQVEVQTPRPVTVQAIIRDADGQPVRTLRTAMRPPLSTATLSTRISRPRLWSPETPHLYDVELRVLEGRRCLDGGVVRMGIRKAEFRGREGFWLNGQRYRQLIGGNRHQDFAYVGNAVPNSQQWRDALRLKQAGMNIVRAAHYPQDPAFMDACDELGLFVIVPTPGWQYYNKDSAWVAMVHQNTRHIIRRDRNHPCVLMWEPILNETRFPEDFALKALAITREEFPFPGRPAAAADIGSAGARAHYDVLYDWPSAVTQASVDTEPLPDKCIFTREWGEYVDDWYAHNALNRAARGWGEHAMLSAALSLASTYGLMHQSQPQFIGGCQWHPFDHQRGYHPDAYLGGIYDNFRQKKYAFEMMRAQSAAEPMLFIAHEMTQSSPPDVVVFSNCDSVRLTALDGWRQLTLPVASSSDGQPHAPVVFPGFWDFWQARTLSYTQRRWQAVTLVAEGIRDGRVVCREVKMPSRRSTRLRLYADHMEVPLEADGSDFIVVVAEVTDDEGHVRRMAREHITFTVEGQGAIIGDAAIMANPRAAEWGSAPILVRATGRPGPIRIIARPTFDGIHAPTPDTLVIESVPAPYPQIANLNAQPSTLNSQPSTLNPQPSTLKPQASPPKANRRQLLEEVEQQQQEFGIQ